MLFLVKHRAVNLQIVFCALLSVSSLNPEYNLRRTDTGLSSTTAKISGLTSECD